MKDKLAEVIQKSLGWDNIVADANCPFIAQAILNLIAKELPEYKKLPELEEPHLEIKIMEWMSKKSYNQCLADIKHKLGVNNETK